MPKIQILNDKNEILESADVTHKVLRGLLGPLATTEYTTVRAVGLEGERETVILRDKYADKDLANGFDRLRRSISNALSKLKE